MKILKSMPNDTAFFERYADLTHSLTKVATIAQVVTGAAEIGILYSLLYPSVIALFTEALKERIDVFFRKKIYAFSDKTQAQPLPDAVRVLHDFKAQTFDEVLQVQSDFEKMKVVKLPTKRHKIAAIVKDDTTKKADEIPSKVRVIGFKKQDDTADDASQKADDTAIHNDFRSKANLSDDTKTIVVTGGDFGKCENCGNDFFRNHKKQRFCGEDCRKESWKNKTGRDFDLSVKNKERRKK